MAVRGGKQAAELRVIRDLAASALACASGLEVERVQEGVSTRVYRIRRDAEVFYLRVLPEVGASFRPEALAHQLLRERGVRVPEVIYLEDCHPDLQRSVMVTAEIKGRHIGNDPVDGSMRRILAEAGRDLAVINSIEVEGFGWIRRDTEHAGSLQGELSTHREFVFESLADDLDLLGRDALSRAMVEAIWTIVETYDAWLDAPEARLAHGDFDVTHIFQEDGAYTGIIDLGEIRGTGPRYDLGHFRMHDGETLPALLLPHLGDGYASVASLPPDWRQRVTLSSLLIAVRALARALRKDPRRLRNHHGLVSIERDVAALRD
jgi:aminoglycoside phosphotransferase (APT) family kinase protein